MQPLSPQRIYVPVSVKDELPKEENTFFIHGEDELWGETFPQSFDSAIFDPEENKFRMDSDHQAQPTHWLKETTLYCLSKSEIEKLLEDAWEAGWNKMLSLVNFEKITVRPNVEEYIKSILP